MGFGRYQQLGNQKESKRSDDLILNVDTVLAWWLISRQNLNVLCSAFAENLEIIISHVIFCLLHQLMIALFLRNKIIWLIWLIGRYYLQTYCRFTEPAKEQEMQFIATNSMQVSQSFILQFELAINCNHHSASKLLGFVFLEYSVDHGMTWKLVNGQCWHSSECSKIETPSIYHSSEFSGWKRVTVILPEPTWYVC